MSELSNNDLDIARIWPATLLGLESLKRLQAFSSISLKNSLISALNFVTSSFSGDCSGSELVAIVVFFGFSLSHGEWWEYLTRNYLWRSNISLLLRMRYSHVPKRLTKGLVRSVLHTPLISTLLPIT